MRRAVTHFLEDNWNSGECVEIITGNSSKMKEIVKEVVEEYKLELMGPSFECRYIAYNSGRLMITME